MNKTLIHIYCNNDYNDLTVLCGTTDHSPDSLIGYTVDFLQCEHYWNDGEIICSECLEHEDYPLLLLGSL